MSIENALAEFREALELPTVGRLRESGDLARLRELIETYTDEARQMIAEMFGAI